MSLWGNFHSARLVIIRLEIASEAVCSLVALVTAWAQRLFLKDIEGSVLFIPLPARPQKERLGQRMLRFNTDETVWSQTQPTCICICFYFHAVVIE